jgi:hypothetical protein
VVTTQAAPIKRCTICGQPNPETAFYRRTWGTLYGHRKTCHRAMTKAVQQKPEQMQKTRERNARW